MNPYLLIAGGMFLAAGLLSEKRKDTDDGKRSEDRGSSGGLDAHCKQGRTDQSDYGQNLATRNDDGTFILQGTGEGDPVKLAPTPPPAQETQNEVPSDRPTVPTLGTPDCGDVPSNQQGAASEGDRDGLESGSGERPVTTGDDQ